MEIKEILTLIDAVSNSNLTSFAYEEGETKLQFEIRQDGIVRQPAVKIMQNETQAPELQADEESMVITSPMVGTFYASASENGSPFIEIGDTVKKGQVIGIVEAMKLMNEIESPYDGIVSSILVKNRDMVGFEQPIVKVKPL